MQRFFRLLVAVRRQQALDAPGPSNMTRLWVFDGLVCTSQGAEREEVTGSPDTREDAGASSGESNTQKVSTHGEAARYDNIVSEAADPSARAPSGQSGKGETTEKPSGGKPGKLPRPEGCTPCPRCDSTDTKFCYYNNYNVKQPRYFCKVGPSHQETSRYWADQPDSWCPASRPLMHPACPTTSVVSPRRHSHLSSLPQDSGPLVKDN